MPQSEVHHHRHRGSIDIKHYNPSKPAKYGLLYSSLYDAVVPYTYYTLSYAGKPSKQTMEHPNIIFQEQMNVQSTL